MTFRSNDGDRDKFDHSLHHYPIKKFDQSLHYYPQKIIYPEQKYYETKHLECDSIYFNGTSSYIDCGDDTSLDINNKLSFFIQGNPDLGATNYLTLISKYLNASNYFYWRINHNTHLFNTYWVTGGTGSGAVTSNTTVSFTKYNSYGLSIDGTTILFYINGKSVGGGNASVGLPTAPHTYIGQRGDNSRWFLGSLYGSLLYDRILTSTEMLSLHKNLPISTNNLVLSLSMKTEGSGDTIVKDLSDNNNDGTLHNCEWDCEWIREKHKVI